MSGLNDEQWVEVKQRLNTIDDIIEEVKDLGKCINELQVSVAEINISLFGVNKNNGLNSQIKKNTYAIEKICGKIPKPKEPTSSFVKGWIPVIVCAILFFVTIYDRVQESITKNIQYQKSITTTSTP